MFVTRTAILFVALLLSACVAVPPPPLSPDAIQRFKITQVSVEGIDVIRSWPAEERKALDAGALDPDAVNRLRSEHASSFPALRARFQQALDERFCDEFATQVTPVLHGARPVKAIVRLRAFDVPSAARRVLVDQNTKIQAEIDLVDPNSRAVLLHYEGPYRAAPLIGGLGTVVALAFEGPDPSIAMARDYVAAYRSWLLQN